jgi:hypothetical protein
LEDTITKLKVQQCQLSDENTKLQGVISQLESVIKTVRSWLRFPQSFCCLLDVVS